MGFCQWFTEQRPVNSALELDLDFERTMKPPPAPTEEGTASLEDLIRCATSIISCCFSG